jgi:hypothetical protein
MNYRNWVAAVSTVLAVAASGATSAAAGGFSMPSTGATVYGAASANTSASASNGYFSYSSRTYAKTNVKVLYGGKIAIGNASAGQSSSYYATGNSKYKSKTYAKSKVYAKGGNIMAKARASTHTKIRAGGKTYVVSKEVARAMTRFTPLGTTSEADARTYISAKSSGYIGVHSGSNTHATVRIRN